LPVSSDIFADQPTDPDLLAELYDLEHDELVEDFVFYEEMVDRSGRRVLDLGCGSGRLFSPLLRGGAERIVGVDGSAALLRRAESRIGGDEELSIATGAGMIRLVLGDVRALGSLDIGETFSLAIAVGLLPHLDGPEEALRLLIGVRSLLQPDGILIIDDVGPAQLPSRDLPLSVDWRRQLQGREVVRRSELMRREAPEGLRVAFSTIVDAVRPDGTIARLPSSHRLWYPSGVVLAKVVAEAGMAVELQYGSHDLDRLGPDSERRIFVVRRAESAAGDRKR
jgi:SAM-dependent methyltransferase